MSASDPQWYLFQSGARPAAENMAMDEALLENAPVLAQPVLRFYRWSEPAASFGYFQKYGDIEKVTPLRPLVRRSTAGGLVPHDADWTYSLIFPPTDPWYALKAVESYRRLHEWIQAAFQKTGIATHLASESKKEAPGQCFAGAEQFDLLWQERKIAGAAQRRSRQGLLIQGSIQPPPNVGREDWLKDFMEVASTWWKVTWLDFELPPRLAERTKELAARKYSQAEYNRRK